MKRLLIACLLAGVASPAMAQTVLGRLTYQNTVPQQIDTYPVLIGYQFGIGQLPSGQCPHVFADSAEIPSVIAPKTTYGDGSLQYANIEFKLTAIPAASVPAQDSVGRLVVTFQPGDCSNQGQTSKDYPPGPGISGNVQTQNVCLPYMHQGIKLANSWTIFLTAPDWHDLPGHPPEFKDRHRTANCLTGR